MILDSNAKHMFDGLTIKPKVVGEELVTVDV